MAERRTGWPVHDAAPYTLLLATSLDADEIAQLVNHAYRPTSSIRGWTHQAELVTGDRTSPHQVYALLGTQSVVLLLRRQRQLLACVHVSHDSTGVCIGMLATRSDVQATGLGTTILQYAERYAVEHFGASVVRMTVLSNRPELLAFYERRGYVATGDAEPFPCNAGVGTPLVADLQVLGLVKRLPNSAQRRPSAGPDHD